MALIQQNDPSIARMVRRREKLYRALNQYYFGENLSPVNDISISNQDMEINTCSYQCKQIIGKDVGDCQTLTNFMEIFLNSKELNQKKIRQCLNHLNLSKYNIILPIIECLSIVLQFAQTKPPQDTKQPKNIFLRGIYSRFVCYTVYRVCLKQPFYYKYFCNWILSMVPKSLFGNNQTIFSKIYFLTECYLLGFPITKTQFLSHIFPNQQLSHYNFDYIYLDYLANFSNILNSPQFLLPSLKSKLYFQSQKVMQKLIRDEKYLLKDLKMNQQLFQIAYCQLQHQKFKKKVSERSQIQLLEKEYNKKFQTYKKLHDKLDQFIQIEQNQLERYSIEGPKANTILEIKQKCRYFITQQKWNHLITPYQRQIYYHHPSLQYHSSQASISLEHDQVFLGQFPQTSSIIRSEELAHYFIQKLANVSNMEKLIKIIYEKYSNFTNIIYIVRVIYIISLSESKIIDVIKNYLKIDKVIGSLKFSEQIVDSNSKMNLIIQLIKYGLLSPLCLVYLTLPQLEKPQVSIRHIEYSIQLIQELGKVSYYRNLTTHLGMNRIIEAIQGSLQKKNSIISKTYEQAQFKLNSIISYLRRQKQASNHSIEFDKHYNHQLSTLNIQRQFKQVLNICKKLVSNKQNFKIINFIEYSVNKNDYITNYYFASLLKEIENDQLFKAGQQLSIECIVKGLLSQNVQGAVCWSRFYGQLYNYEIISLKNLIEGLQLIMNTDRRQGIVSLQSVVKCVNSALDTSKSYLYDERRKHLLIILLISLKKIIIKEGPLKNSIIQDQFMELLGYFEDDLVSKLNTINQIDTFFIKVGIISSKNGYKLKQFHIKDIYSKISCDISILLSNFTYSQSKTQKELTNYQKKSDHFSINQVSQNQSIQRVIEQYGSIHNNKYLQQEQYLKNNKQTEKPSYQTKQIKIKGMPSNTSKVMKVITRVKKDNGKIEYTNND